MVLISAGIMSVSLLRKNEPFFNIHEIVQEYRKLIRGSTIVFFILPLLFGNRRHTGDYSFHAFGVTQHFVQLRFFRSQG